MSQTTFTYAEVELMVKEASEFAYAQGKNEAFVNIADFIESAATHPAKPSLAIVIEKIRSGEVA